MASASASLCAMALLTLASLLLLVPPLTNAHPMTTLRQAAKAAEETAGISVGLISTCCARRWTRSGVWRTSSPRSPLAA
jgi:hypothetical protein